MSKCNMCIHGDLCVNYCVPLMEAAQRRAMCPQYKDKTKFVEKPCSRVYYISDQGTDHATVMSKSIDDLYLYELSDLKNSGYYIDFTDAGLALRKMK